MSTRRRKPSVASRRVEGIQEIALDALHEHPDNPRTIDPERFEQLKTMLAADPEMLRARPLIALPDGTVIAGNQRLRAAAELGWQTIPTVYADLDDETARLWMLRDNNPMGEWSEGLGEMLAFLERRGVDMALAGFDPRDLDSILVGVDRQRPIDPDDVPDPPAKPRSKAGEVYELGAHRLLCGDVTNPERLSALMAGDTAALVVTSPPYNQGLDQFKPSGMQREAPAWVKRMAEAYPDSRPEPEYQDEQVAVLDALMDVTDDRASVFYNHKIRYRAAVAISPRQWLDRTRWKVRQELVWDRAGSITLNARMFMPVDERIYWLTRGKFRFANAAATKALGTIWRITPRNDVPVSAPFPVELPARCIAACSARGDVVLDPYAGSGTTLIAAEMAGRRCYALEVNPAYCDVIRDRYEAFVA